MGSIQNTVHYCCVSKGNRTLYEYGGGDHEIENLAALCLERTPPFHKWYFETISQKTFGFLIEDGYVYFIIVDKGLENLGVLKFLEHIRDEFKNFARKGSKGSFSGMSSIGVQEQLVPVIQRLVTSLEHVSYGGNDWKDETPSSDHEGLSPSPNNANVQLEAASSTKAPLLGKSKSSKQEKKKLKDHVIAVRDIELEEHRKSTDRGVKLDSTALDSNNQNGASSSISLQKDFGSMRIRSGSQSIRKKWWRHVRIVLAIDAAVCLLLLVIWLSICKGIECTHS
ncbi:phytolongin Phyl1.1-like [Durio zibethinus]|uniref:Phytolongin Phyl1.1-like n=1 Tax=Durio zibethinus TaxID=66656 RepID=A0A6P6AFL6_DURZI|nr:phytolongin Phyl1.1-like [Durio zibethinus]XP_022763659.1 phytolongin Phyl1.1-like [Durio zibethinus]XP_022763660.1 phytolongin Phyl1.1-like [Durio zibethinus]XP_022763661.1 phytolongin Phyl1.1-like [Durio zibethinus]